MHEKNTMMASTSNQSFIKILIKLTQWSWYWWMVYKDNQYHTHFSSLQIRYYGLLMFPLISLQSTHISHNIFNAIILLILLILPQPLSWSSCKPLNKLKIAPLHVIGSGHQSSLIKMRSSHDIWIHFWINYIFKANLWFILSLSISHAV